MAPKVALITGASGFVGSHLAARLVTDGWNVHAVVRVGSRDTPRRLPERVATHIHDGTDRGMLRIAETVRPSIVFHTASLFVSDHSADQVSSLIESNIRFGTQLLEAMWTAGVTRLINTGTAWQHYQGREYSPVNLYAATKQAFEAIIQYYVEARSCRVITLELFDTYGPHDERGKLLSTLRRAIDDRYVMEMSPGEQVIDLVHVDDVVDAYLVAAKRTEDDTIRAHERYSVSSGYGLSLRELVTLVETATHTTLPVAWGRRAYRPREVMQPVTTAVRLPGWTPKVKMEQGIPAYFQK